MPGVDNYAHAGVASAAATWRHRCLDPLKPERIDHLAIAVACLAASVLAVVASVLHGFQFFG